MIIVKISRNIMLKSLKSESAFTLIELAVFFIFISIITVAVVDSRTLLTQSRLIKSYNQIKQFKIAVKTFEDSYGQLPGDMDNATDYWPTAQNPGNDNGKYDHHLLTDTSRTDGEEIMAIYQHLSLANLITGEYSGLYNGAFIIGRKGKLPTSDYGNGISYWFIGST